MKITLTFDNWEDFESFCADNRKDGGTLRMTVKQKSAKATTTPAIVETPDVPEKPANVPEHATIAPAIVDPPAKVPTDEKTYVLDDLSKAAMSLMQSGKQEELSKLLSGYGVASLRDLSADQYGLFATGLRTLGAPI